MRPLSLPKNRRLVNNRQFKAVLECNKRASDDVLTVYMAANNCKYPRLGVSVGKACGKAVTRNRIKRLLREAFRQSQHQLPAGFDYVLMISPQLSKKLKKSADAKELLKQLTFERLRKSLLQLVNNILRQFPNEKPEPL